MCDHRFRKGFDAETGVGITKCLWCGVERPQMEVCR